jgi:hypothetical protein
MKGAINEKKKTGAGGTMDTEYVAGRYSSHRKLEVPYPTRKINLILRDSGYC